MRLMTWNCRAGNFRGKATHVAPYRPDVLVVQECERLNGQLLFGGEHQPTCQERLGDTRRAIAAFSYTDVQLTPVDAAAPMLSFRRYQAERAGLTFQVVGVWTVETDSSQTSYMQAHEGIRDHAEWIRQRPTVI